MEALNRRLCLATEIAGQRALFALEDGANLLGRDRGNHLVLDFHGVSQQHALILRDGDALEVVDQESKNGTFVNGARIRRAQATLGDKLWLGALELAVEEVSGEEIDLAIRVSHLRKEGDALTKRSTGMARRRSCSAEAWRQVLPLLIAEFSESGDGRGSGDASAPGRLSRLLSGLRISAVGVLELSDDRPPVSLASWGGIEPFLAGTIRRRWLGRTTPRFFFSDSQMTFIVATEADGKGLGIAFLGDFETRRESELLLWALLSVFRQGQRQGQSAAGGQVSPQSGRLTFPQGYVEGSAPASQRLHSQLLQLAAARLPVLICGETGVGKELVARILHLSSDRSAAPFVAINCAAIPADLLEAELFGIGRGVATGVTARCGLLVEANGGTVLLDEIGEMSDPLQAKLLRVLQEREVRPIGGTPVKIDLRVLSATNVEIHSQMEAGRFRRDLFYRLAGSVLRIAPLRERQADVAILLEVFLRRFSAEAGSRVRGITVAAQRTLTNYEWPGNVRELQHEIRRLVYTCAPGQPIVSSSLNERIRQAAAVPITEEIAMDSRIAEAPSAGVPVNNVNPALTEEVLPTLDLEALQQLAIDQALARSGGHRAAAAKFLGLSRFALMRRLKRRVDDSA